MSMQLEAGVIKTLTDIFLYGRDHTLTTVHTVPDCQDLHTGGCESTKYGMGMRRERRDIME